MLEDLFRGVSEYTEPYAVLVSIRRKFTSIDEWFIEGDAAAPIVVYAEEGSVETAEVPFPFETTFEEFVQSNFDTPLDDE